MKIPPLLRIVFCLPISVVALVNQVSPGHTTEDALLNNSSTKIGTFQAEEDNFAILEAIALTDDGIILIIDGQQMGEELALDSGKKRLSVVLQGTTLATAIPIKEDITDPQAGVLKRRVRIKQLEPGLVEVSLNAPATEWGISSHNQGVFLGPTASRVTSFDENNAPVSRVESPEQQTSASAERNEISAPPLLISDSVESEPASEELVNGDNDADPTRLREDLRVDPIQTVSRPQPVYAPITSAGIPSAFGASWGDFYIGVAGATADKVRDEVDGGVAVGFGLGDNRKFVGLEFNYNNLSIRDFGANGSFDAKVHRIVYASSDTQVAAAVGWNNFTNYGSDPAGTASSVYGIVNVYHFLGDNPENPLPINLSLGVGGAPFFASSDVGIIAGAGMQVHPNIGVSAAWSGLGLNLAASYLPVRTLPLTLNVIYGDVLNNTAGGSILAVGIGYGFDFTPNF